jgi:stage II sporulation protein R
LGEWKGANWWCVLFPPLCFLDFSNGVAVSAGFEDKKKEEKSVQQAAGDTVKVKKAAPVYTKEDEQPIKVKFFVVELWEKLFD